MVVAVVVKMAMTPRQSLFFAPKNKALAKKITIRSPLAFDQSIRRIKKGGVTLEEKRGLVLAQNRARAQLGRKNLSLKERIEFNVIASRKLPKVNK